MKLIEIFQNKINPETCYIIGEIGLNHNGSLDIGKKLIDVCAIAGADAVKFQKRTVEDLAVKSVLDAQDSRFPEFGKTYGEIRNHLEFDFTAYRELKEYAEQKGLEFLCTSFDKDAVIFLERLGVRYYKLASHSLTNIPLLNSVAKTGKPTILSTGMCELDEIDDAVAIFKHAGTPLVLLHCVSAYPTPLEECNLSMISFLKERYGVPVGYSGHEIGLLPTLASVAMGAECIERHITLDHTMIGFDHRISLEPCELITLVREVKGILAARGKPIKQVSPTENITRQKYHVSAVSACKIPIGTFISEDMIVYKNPGTGIAPRNIATILGKRARKDIPEDIILEMSWFE
ncbi:MAG: N-acetylneuraminate synthase family protein [Methanoregula sp.]